jgi:hypothetical protein
MILQVYFCSYQIVGRASKIYLEDCLILQVYFCPFQIVGAFALRQKYTCRIAPSCRYIFTHFRLSGLSRCAKNIPGGSPHPAGIFLSISDCRGVRAASKIYLQDRLILQVYFYPFKIVGAFALRQKYTWRIA